MWWLASDATQRYAAEYFVRWQIEETKWQTPAYIRSWRAFHAALTRHHGRIPKSGIAPLFEL